MNDLKRRLLNLIIAAKRDDPETGSFAEWLAEYLVEHGVTVQEWIPTSEKLPERYTIKVEEGFYEFLEFNVMIGAAELPTTLCFNGKEWISRDGGDAYDVRCWMPLPEPPGKDGA